MWTFVRSREMSEVIVLSDSHESVSSIEDERVPLHSKKSFINSPVSSDFEFPEIQFDQVVDGTETAIRRYADIDIEMSLDSHDSTINKNYEFSKEECLETPETLTDNKSLGASCSNDLQNNGLYRSSFHAMSISSESEKDNGLNVELTNNNFLKKDSQKSKRGGAKKDRATVREERLKRQEILAREKGLKAIASKRSKDKKPGECMKFMEVTFDESVRDSIFYNEIIDTLENANVKYKINRQFIPNSIIWRRNIEESYIDNDNKICTKTSTQTESQIVVIWNAEETVNKILSYNFCSSVSSIKSLMSEYNLTLVIFGIQNYFSYKKKMRRKVQSKSQKHKDKDIQDFENLPEITIHELEMCLTEIQVTCECNSRLIENAQDLALMIYQYTKAIAEIPYKLEKRQALNHNFDWYVFGDNKNSVHVDKNGNGLKRLWQQQLCQFNLSSLEIAQAICSVYASPAELIEAYMNCTPEEGVSLLKDIPIRRAAGPLTATRKVGIELSKKIYIMFTSEDGETLLDIMNKKNKSMN